MYKKRALDDNCFTKTTAASILVVFFNSFQKRRSFRFHRELSRTIVHTLREKKPVRCISSMYLFRTEENVYRRHADRLLLHSA